MRRRLFLCGPAFSGRSRLIRSSLGDRLQTAGGFCTALTTDLGGGLRGCSMMPAAAAGGAAGLEEELFLDLRQIPPGHDSEVFRGLGVRLLSEARWYPFAVLDELGGMDLIIPQFRTELETLLQSELPVLGALKSRESAEQMRQLLGPGERFTAFWDALYRRLQDDPDTEILEISEGAEKEASEAVEVWVREYASLQRLM